ncbi:uncharacterized protein LOC124258276 [Haliotis rubra]|uniref:uncharacterized protein LOC124258276 n=1 Tax=Haliotis rubra TaxID=36100 RepID=UPI001EE6278C|nr:uncharacterized protein LOC124258276 [Haliotis rubra]
MGKVKIATSHGHTIPRLELCAAVMAVDLAEMVWDSLNIDSSDCRFYSDSKIVLGYIRNTTKKFKVYVSNRVARILKFSTSDQWNYVLTSKNPADDGTRVLDAAKLEESKWLNGPRNASEVNEDKEMETTGQETDDTEVVSEATLFVEQNIGIGTDRFSKFSSWKNLIAGIAWLKTLARMSKAQRKERDGVSTFTDSENFVIREVQG